MVVRRKTTLARRLRQEMTDAERRLWQALREPALPQRFRRQHPVGRYIVDFACPAAKLAIELDGGQHALQNERDEVRTAEITAHGYRVLRFWNGDVIDNLAGVLTTILRELDLSLSAPRGGEGRGEVGDSARGRSPPHPPRRLRDGSPPSPPASGRRGQQ
jgi:very-short-patch-repair endonuclease